MSDNSSLLYDRYPLYVLVDTSEISLNYTEVGYLFLYCQRITATGINLITVFIRHRPFPDDVAGISILNVISIEG